MEKLHLYELAAKYDVNILLKKEVLARIRKKARTQYKTWNKLFLAVKPDMPLTTFKSLFKDSYPNYRPFVIFEHVCRLLDINLDFFESSIIAYKTKRGEVVVASPNLPVLIGPLFDMLVAHIFADGNCRRDKFRLPRFCYTQSRANIRLEFVKKAEKVFGKLKYPREYFVNGVRVCLPSTICSIVSEYYGLAPEDYLENNARLPKKMLSHSDSHMLAVLIAFIIDEGHIDSGQIVIGLQNKGLLKDLKFICDKLDFENSICLTRKQGCLYILSNGVKLFWKKYQSLKNEYPEVNMCYKEAQIADFILRKNKFWRTLPQNETKNQLISLLNHSPRGINELSKIQQISRQGIRYHLMELEQKGYVEKSGKGYAASDIYKLKKYALLPSSKRGRSRQYGVTEKDILELLKTPATTKEVALSLGIDRATILNLLCSMEKKRQIKRAGKKIQKTHPSIVWELIQN